MTGVPVVPEDAHDLVFGHRRKPQRIGLAQIALVGKGKLLEIALVLNRVDVDTREFLCIEAIGDCNELLELGLDDVKLLFGHVHGA